MNGATSSDGDPCKLSAYVSLTNEICSLAMPAPPNRSITFASTPQVMGLMKPSGGGGEYDELIRRICATSVGSFGIQFPMTIRPPWRVTLTISLATSNGLGENMAPKMLTTRAKV